MNMIFLLMIILSTSTQLVLVASRAFPLLSSLALYGIFITAACAGGISLVLWRKDYLTKVSNRVRCYALVELLWSSLMLSAAFKLLIYDNNTVLANSAFAWITVVALLSKIFWKSIFNASQQLWQVMCLGWGRSYAPLLMDVVVLFSIIILIYVPDMEGVVALSFVGEQWHHLDYFVMSPGLGVLYGQIPYMDIISQYGVGIPVVFPKIAQAIGGFNYLNVLNITMVCVIVYFVLMYIFLRFWIGSIALSVAAILTGLRLQMMQYGISPLIWLYPSATAIRLCFDIVFFILLLLYLRRGGLIKLVFAALMVGGSVFWMTSTGVAMAASFMLFLGLLVITKQLKLIYAFALAGLSGASAVFFIALAVGAHITDPAFWRHWFEYMYYFTNLYGHLPIYDSLRYRFYLSSLVGFLIPLVYAFTLLYVGAMWYLRKVSHEYLLAVIIAAYGLGQYTYYVVHSVQTGYDMVALPFVWLCVFWLAGLLSVINATYHRRIKIGLAALSLYALLTNHNFISYPNAVNMSRNPLVDPLVIQLFPDRRGYFNHQVKFMKEADKLPLNSLGNQDEGVVVEANFMNQKALKEYVKREADFTKDAQLISSLIPQGGRAALLSSFETAMLMQAKRAPFFYHTPLTASRPMRMRFIPSDAAHTPRFLEDSIAQLSTEKPSYVFLERIMLTEDLPESLKKNNASIIGIIDYIKQHYAVHSQGQYLVALKRKD